MTREAAVEILIYKPISGKALPPERRGVLVNPHIKKRFKQSIAIGVYLESKAFKEIRYYLFEDLNEPSEKMLKIYKSLSALKDALPKIKAAIFDKRPKLYIMGHGGGGFYGLSNHNIPSEIFADETFDKLLFEFKSVLPHEISDIGVTLEACNTDNLENALAVKQSKPFLERVSSQHREMTFFGSGPWNDKDAETGFRAHAKNVAATSTVGNVWKSGNRIIFHHLDEQLAVKKSLFSTEETAKALKVNTMLYAKSLLEEMPDEALVRRIALDRDCRLIRDLKKYFPFYESTSEGMLFESALAREKEIRHEEKSRYIKRVNDILMRANPVDELSDRDILQLTLGIKDRTVYKGEERVLIRLLDNKVLLGRVLVSCGKVLIAGPSNDKIITYLLQQGVDINVKDQRGMTALHYAAESFFNYRIEPLKLIETLLSHGANVSLKDNENLTPIERSERHSQDKRVLGSDKLMSVLQRALSADASDRNIKCSV